MTDLAISTVNKRRFADFINGRVPYALTQEPGMHNFKQPHWIYGDC